MRVCCGNRWAWCMLFINIWDSLTAPCVVCNSAIYTAYGRCGQYGQSMFIRCPVRPVRGLYGPAFLPKCSLAQLRESKVVYGEWEKRRCEWSNFYGLVILCCVLYSSLSSVLAVYMVWVSVPDLPIRSNMDIPALTTILTLVITVLTPTIITITTVICIAPPTS